MIRSKIAVILLGAAALAVAGTPAGAQMPGFGGAVTPNLEGFTVAGKGAVGARPNRLEIDLEVSAASEMTSDVIVKYRDAKKRIQEAFTTLKMGNVSVEERALLVDKKGQVFNPYMMDMPPATRGKVEVQLTRKLVINCVNIRDLDEEALLQLVAKLLDVAQDAGGKVGGSTEFNPYYYRMPTNTGLVRFILDDFDALQEKAYQAAIADARARAGRLARLSGVELGPVAGVREVLVPGEKAQQQSFAFYDVGTSTTDEEMPRKRLESTRFQEIPIKVELQVRFANASPVRAQGREGGQ
jgi:uncharacterized protein YggE